MSQLKQFCQNLSDHLKQDCPQASLFWVFCDHDDRMAAFQDITYAIDRHPAAPLIHDAVTSMDTGENATPLVSATSYKPTFMFAQKQYATVIWVNTKADFMPEAMRILHHVFLILCEITGQSDASANTSFTMTAAAEAFAALYLALYHDPSSLQKIGKSQVQQALTAPFAPIPLFPVLADMTRTVYKEIRDIRNTNHPVSLKKCSRLALDIVKRVQTNTFKSWQEFVTDARYMAFAGHEPEAILGTAIYSSEDLYKRINAYLAIEVGQIAPHTVTRFEFYNPFSDDEANAKNHRMVSMNTLIQTQALLYDKHPDLVYDQEIDNQNSAFSYGQAMGWCVPALLKAKSKAQADHTIEPADYKNDLTPWRQIKNAFHTVMQQKKEGRDTPPSDIYNIIMNS